MKALTPPRQPQASTSARSARTNSTITVSLGPTSLSPNGLTVNLTIGGICLACEKLSASVASLDLSLLADLVVQKLQQSITASPEKPFGVPTNGPVEAKKKVRTKTGCITCRTRRTKCDEAKPVCSSCQRDPNRACRYNVALGLPTPQVRAAVARRASSLAVAPVDAPPPPRRDEPWGGPTAQGPVQGMVHPPLKFPSPDTWGRDVDMLAALLPPERSRELLHHVATSIFVFLSPSTSRRKNMSSPLDGYVQLGCSIALVPPKSRTIAATGLLNSILALGAGHLSYLRQGASQDDSQWSKSLRSSSVGAISLLEDGNGGHLTAGSAGLGSEVELVLATVGILMYRDCITADPDVVRPLASAAATIKHNGGPAMLLLLSQSHMYGSTLDYCKLLVYLALVDVFVCLVSGDAPSILTSSELVWYEQQSDCSSVVEGVCGVSQAMLLATAEVCHLVHKAVQRGPTADLQAAAVSFFVGLDEHWPAKIAATPTTLRVQIGDLMFRHYLIAFLLVKVFEHDGRVHPRIQQCNAAIKELVVEAACLTGQMTGTLMPILFAGTYCDTASRETFIHLLDLTKDIPGCWDVDAAERIVREVWRRRDLELDNWTYEEVIRDDPSLQLLLV